MPASISPPTIDDAAASDSLAPQAFEELDAILDEMRTRNDETPQWEFCEGFMAALACGRRAIAEAEYWEVLLGISSNKLAEGDASAPAAEEQSQAEGSFTDDARRNRFVALWTARWQEVITALDTDVQSLEDERCYHPEVMDVRAAVAELPIDEQSKFTPEELPAFAQVWALGFMFAVESWPQDWQSPRDKAAAKDLDSALQAIVAMTEDDTGAPAVSPLQEDGPPSTSIERLNAFGDAIWAVYALRELWKGLGPRVETVRKETSPGRNEACPCGSGKKYKKCHGAT